MQKQYQNKARNSRGSVQTFSTFEASEKRKNRKRKGENGWMDKRCDGRRNSRQKKFLAAAKLRKQKGQKEGRKLRYIRTQETRILTKKNRDEIERKQKNKYLTTIFLHLSIPANYTA